MCFRCGPLAGRYLVVILTCETAIAQVQFRDVVAKLANIVRQRKATVELNPNASGHHADNPNRQSTCGTGELGF